MAIDNPIDAYQQQYMKEEPELPMKLAKVAGKLGFPDGGLAFEILLKIAEGLFDDVSIKERVVAMFDLIKGEFAHVETTKVSHDNMQKASRTPYKSC